MFSEGLACDGVEYGIRQPDCLLQHAEKESGKTKVFRVISDRIKVSNVALKLHLLTGPETLQSKA